MIEKERQITVWVSLGSGYEMTRVPDMVGLSRITADEQANMHEIIPIFVKEYDEEVEEGRVIRQEIEAMTEVEKHTTVEVFVSAGPRPNQSSYIRHGLVEGRTGVYIFSHYIDGILDHEKTQNVALNQTILWEFEGSGVQRYAIEITSLATGRTVLFCEYEVDFTGPEPVKTEIQLNGTAFTEANRPVETEPPATTTTPPPPPEPEPQPEPDYEDDPDDNFDEE